ncbi:SPX domain-containing membrane protein Os06g0129400 [Selaginella moellendorffii]|uniref:SPX domain-containing membrane protein Os06g0129400 n=1 Tax=Selaginella moellendorffii TaxID=88036 RepID=UPI000D1C6139|nr:SPX domain-containing membrane protein Os06g0129400 [Selaginella moellendorffii]|eukprot:XP_024536516.1 SPX domain-containing membrane protein Os06g0129400 [Selaginella moellendorffii]
MVAFGKKLREQRVSEWKDYYISYKMMKKKVKYYSQHGDFNTREDRQRVLKEFSSMLDRQIEKIVLFLIVRQGDLAERLRKLGAERERCEKEQPADLDWRDRFRDAYNDVGKDLLKLLYFVEVNAIGLRKILKKFDKHIGYRLTDYYVSSRSNHPYSQLQQVFKHVGIGAMVGALTRNLSELEEHRKSLTSIYDYPDVPARLPIVESIKAAQERLTNSTNFLQFLGQHAMLMKDEFPRAPGEEDVQEEQYHLLSLILNLANTFLYMVNTYIIVPTADKYALSMGAAPTLCGVIIGAMAVAQLVSSVYFSAWSNTSYFRPLIFSSVMLFMGNLLYAVAYDCNSLSLLLVGRLLCGLGSARAVNRRYISDCVPLKSRLQASAGFVSASALGMAAGPALAGVLEFNKKFVGMTFNANTLPGWAMAICWILYLAWLWVSFKEPARPIEVDGSTSGGQSRLAIDNGFANEKHKEQSDAEEGMLQPLNSSYDSREETEIEDENDVEGEREEDEVSEDNSKQPANSIREAYNLLTLPVKVQLLIYFMLKYAVEVLISESSVVTSFYFHWDVRNVAIFLALLGLTVLPVNAVVGSCLSNIFEDRQILLAAEILTCVGVLVSFSGPFRYTIVQYIAGAVLIFVSAEVLEGVNLSLLSKVMSSRLARGTFNGGLLSTEAGTLARVIADGTITVAGYLREDKLLNATLFPTFVIGIVSVVATLFTYNSMF